MKAVAIGCWVAAWLAEAVAAAAVWSAIRGHDRARVVAPAAAILGAALAWAGAVAW